MMYGLISGASGNSVTEPANCRKINRCRGPSPSGHLLVHMMIRADDAEEAD
jgi:hypothetical protein